MKLPPAMNNYICGAKAPTLMEKSALNQYDIQLLLLRFFDKYQVL